jgi:hypothetical protein
MNLKSNIQSELHMARPPKMGSLSVEREQELINELRSSFREFSDS